MGRKRRLSRRRPPTPPGTSEVDYTKWLGHCGMIAVLFETPSGFAIFYYDGVKLFRPKAMEDIWADFAKDYLADGIIRLREFQTFKDKTSSINLDTGVSDQLAKMIKKWLLPRQWLAVGSLEYKTILQASLGIFCLFNEAVMELMWGLKNIMKSLVPGETLELTKEDCLTMSEGMKIVLNRYGFYVKPEMVNRRIIEATYAIYECDYCVNKYSKTLRLAAKTLKEVSGINSENWDLPKLASAIKIICCPEDSDSVMFSDAKVDRSKLVAEAPKYEGKFFKMTSLTIYSDIVWALGVRDKAHRLLMSLVKEAREAYEAEQVESAEKPRVSGSSSQKQSDLREKPPSELRSQKQSDLKRPPRAT